MNLAARPLRAVLFDLDGTLLDTVADITRALNAALGDQGLPDLPAAQVRTFIGRGVPVLIERALVTLGAGGDAGRLLERFHAHYQWLDQHGQLQARAFPGVEAGLAALHGAGLKLAVVTNKPARAARDVLRSARLARWIDVVVAGDSGLAPKPDPAPLLRACEELAVPPHAALMVGDSRVDVLAARAAGLAVVCVPYGYNEGQDPRALPCDAFVESLAELPALLARAP